MLLGQFWQSHAFAVQDELAAPPKDAVFHLAIGESRRACDWLLTARGHFFLGVPLRTRMATTVWSSKVSTPAECSAAALKSESTTQVADFPSHSAMIRSTRPRPKSSPLRLRASRIPSLKNTNISPGFMRNLNSS